MSTSLIIIILTVAVSFFAFQSQELFHKLQFNAYQINTRKEWWRFFSYGLIHADFFHLLVNMYVLYMFGNATEQMYSYRFAEKGPYFFVLMYVSSVFVSVIASFEKHKHNVLYNAVGASGAVSAVVFAAILFNPTMSLYLFFIPIPIPAFVFGLLYLIYSYYMGKKANDNIGHDAHFFGAVFGIMFTILMDKDLAIEFVEQIKYTYFE
jgi:membrane associated rhomboid family serine protease